jgi:hypothetical protein
MAVTTGPGTYLSNLVLGLLRGTSITPPSTLTLRLMSTATTATALGTQMTGTNYADLSITLNATNFSTSTTGTTTILTDQLFQASINGWSSPIASMALIDGSSNIWWFWNFAVAQITSNGDTVDFPASSLSLSLTYNASPVTGMGQYLANKVLALFQGTTLTAPTTMNFRLMTTTCSWTTLGTQETGTSYADQALTCNTTNFTAPSGGSNANNTQINWSAAVPDGTWGTPIVSVAAIDSTPNIWWFGNLSATKPIQAGQAVDALVGALVFTIQDVTA